MLAFWSSSPLMQRNHQHNSRLLAQWKPLEGCPLQCESLVLWRAKEGISHSKAARRLGKRERAQGEGWWNCSNVEWAQGEGRWKQGTGAIQKKQLAERSSRLPKSYYLHNWYIQTPTREKHMSRPMNRARRYWIIAAAPIDTTFTWWWVPSLSCFLMADKQVALPIDALALCFALLWLGLLCLQPPCSPCLRRPPPPAQRHGCSCSVPPSLCACPYARRSLLDSDPNKERREQIPLPTNWRSTAPWTLFNISLLCPNVPHSNTLSYCWMIFVKKN